MSLGRLLRRLDLGGCALDPATAAFGVRVVVVTVGPLLALDGATDWAALIASTSWAFFIDPAPETPMPLAIDLRSASSIELRPPLFFLAVEAGSVG